MDERKSAYFLYRPRRISDLRVPHPLSAERYYDVVGEVSLPFIDFENFSEDMLADRAFLEQYKGSPSINGVFQCLRVTCKSKRVQEQILVVPKGDFVFHAAVTIP